MPYASKLSPEQWAEARRLRAEGVGFSALGKRFGLRPNSMRSRARKEGWATLPGEPPPRIKPPRRSPATADIRSELALRLYSVVALRIRMMELRMTKQLQDQQAGDAAPAPSPHDERDAFAALIANINQVTEMASEPDRSADGRTTSAGPGAGPGSGPGSGADADGLALASQKDAFRREIAERLEKLFPPQ